MYRKHRSEEQSHGRGGGLRLHYRRARSLPLLSGNELCCGRSIGCPRDAARSGTLSGLSDGGAHVGSVVDASMPTYLLTHWARDRKRGPGLPLETVVKAQAAETADFFGLKDRGRIAPACAPI